MHRRNFNDGQEVVLADLNAVTTAIERGLYDRLMYQTLQRVEDGFFGDSFEVTYSSATAVIVADGLGFQSDTSQTNPECEKRPLVNESDTIYNITTPDGTNPRIDIVVVKNAVVDDLTESRKFKDAISDAISTESLVTQKKWEAEISIVAGTPGAVPVAPSTPAGYLKIAELYVTAVTGLAGAGAITDSRTKMPVGGDIFLNTTGLLAVTAGAGTTLDTLIADIDALLVSAIYDTHTVGADYVVLDNDGYRTVIINDTSSDRTVTLPTASANTNRFLTVINSSTDGGNLTVDGEGAELINGKLTWDLPDRWDTLTMQCNGTGWQVHSYTSSPDAGSVVVKSGDYTILDGDGFDHILVDDTSSDRTITLPTAADNKGREIFVKNTSTDGGKVTLDGEGAETIDGNASIDIYLQNDDIRVICDATGWQVKGEYPTQLIQDYLEILSVGTALQQQAGHLWETDEMGSGTDIANYQFLNGALTVDQESAYALTNVGTVTDGNGIFGSDYAAVFTGANYFTQATLLDSLAGLSSGLYFDLWYKPDDGQPAASEYLLDKYEDANNWIYLYYLTDGRMVFNVNAAGTNKGITAYPLLNGANPWMHVAASIDTTYGTRMWINQKYVGGHSDMTTLPTLGTSQDLHIGADYGHSSFFNGKLGGLRFIDKLVTQKDIDKAYSVRYTKPSIFSGDDFEIQARVKEEGSDDFVSQTQFEEVARNSSYFYGYGEQFKPTDKVRLIGK